LRIVRSCLDGKSSRTELALDFPYELEQRYREMRAEDWEYAELIYSRLVRDGVTCWDRLSDKDFRAKVQETYDDVLAIATNGFWVKRDFL
jgi:hypothetical protein